MHQPPNETGSPMESILDYGVRVVLWFQQFSPPLDVPFKVLTMLGETVFFLMLMPFLYWCLDRSLGLRLTILFLLSAYLNTVAKVLAGQPRPFQYDPRVKQLFSAGGGGFPSGHTQSAVIVWGFLAVRYRKMWLWGIALLLIILIPLSRVYLGVHFPTDLLGGYVLGALFLVLYLRLEGRAGAWLDKKGFAWQLGAALGMPLLLLAASPPGNRHIIDACATLMGVGAGAALEQKWIRFSSGGLWRRRLFRFLLGGIILFALWRGLGMIMGSLEPRGFYRFVRYLLVGLWVGAGAPWLFVRTGLAGIR